MFFYDSCRPSLNDTTKMANIKSCLLLLLLLSALLPPTSTDEFDEEQYGVKYASECEVCKVKSHTFIRTFIACKNVYQITFLYNAQCFVRVSVIIVDACANSMSYQMTHRHSYVVFCRPAANRCINHYRVHQQKPDAQNFNRKETFKKTGLNSLKIHFKMFPFLTFFWP